MILEMPFDSSTPDFEYSIELEQVVYVLRFQYNDRSTRWSMSFYDENRVLLMGNIPLVNTWGLIRRFQNESLPPGEFMVFNGGNEDLEPSRYSFGVTHTLVYSESGTDLNALL